MFIVILFIHITDSFIKNSLLTFSESTNSHVYTAVTIPMPRQKKQTFRDLM